MMDFQTHSSNICIGCFVNTYMYIYIYIYIYVKANQSIRCGRYINPGRGEYNISECGLQVKVKDRQGGSRCCGAFWYMCLQR